MVLGGLQNMKIKHKLTFVMMLVSLVALFLAGTTFIIIQWIDLRFTMVSNLSTQAKMTANNCKASLTFGDAEGAQEILAAFRIDPSIDFAGIYTEAERPFAVYYRNEDSRPIRPSEIKESDAGFKDGFLTVFRSISLDGEEIGTVCLRSNLLSMHKLLRNNVETAVIVVFFTALTAYFVSSRLQRVISQPILGLAEVAKHVSERKEYSERATKQSNDETGFLIDAFNEMLSQIQQRDLALVGANERLETTVQQRMAELTEEIAERKKAEDALEQLNEQLKEAVKKLTISNRELRELTYITAHDLKTPLRAIATLADWISTDYADKFDEQGKRHVKLLIGRAKRMSELIDAILQYSEIGRTPQKLVKVDLNVLLSEVIGEVAVPANIEITIENELPELECGSSRIAQVFGNLLGNAVKYMDKADGKIRVACSEEDGFWKFSVADNGPGIGERYFEKIFQIFQTLSPRDESGGVGVGLTVAKKIVELHGGKIWVRSEPGRGSTFFFTLPRQEEKIEDAKLEANTAC